jgi:polyhydroxyalkanoate synthase subunit PhaC
MSPELTSGLTQLASYSTRAAKAAAALSKIRDEDVEVATTPREVVARIGGRTLYRIAVDAPKRVETPVLVVYAMVGHWTILDLQPDRSFLRNLAEGGCEVYMLDWGHPTAADQFDDFSDLVDIVMDGFVDAICDRHDIPSVNLAHLLCPPSR